MEYLAYILMESIMFLKTIITLHPVITLIILATLILACIDEWAQH